MSLNGLDDSKVQEAYATAVAEAGGWFLLKYASRDEVELLERGTGGIVDIRDEIAKYEDSPPLYGFLRYRRRNVIIKYLPEDCSRLIQARSTVHFNLLCDHFAPYDTTFTIAEAKELKDTKLSAACSLHASAGSTGSNSSATSSLRRRRLVEIAEEDEEDHREKKRQSVVKEEQKAASPALVEEMTSTSRWSPGPPPPVTLNSVLASSPEESQFAGTTDPPSFIGLPRPYSPTRSFDEGGGRRNSSQSTRHDYYTSSSSYTYKPKVKLGPRPSLETGGRPRTSGSTESARPVSHIPAGFKLATKGSKRSQSQDKIILEEGESSPVKEKGLSAETVSFVIASTPHSDSHSNQPARSESEIASLLSSSNASLKSNLPTMGPPPAPAAKQNHITPEKARLMKAMKLREKKKLLSAQSTETLKELPAPPNQADLAPTPTADPAVMVDTAHEDALIDARTDSYPTSPVASSSDVGESTKASSLSEVTDETILLDQQHKDLLSAEDRADEDVNETIRVSEEPKDRESELPNTELELGVSEGGIVEGRAQAIEPRLESKHEIKHETEELEGTGESQDLAGAEQGGLLDTISLSVANEPSDEQNPVLPISSFTATSPAQANEEEIHTATAALPSLVPSGEVEPAGTLSQPEAASTPPSPGVISTTPDSPLKIPLSKFSTRDSQSPTTPGSVPLVITPGPEDEDGLHGELTGRSIDGQGAGETTERASIDTARSKPRAVPEPTRTGLKSEVQGETDLSDDDDLMDELQSATFQQARPMTVSKSPIAPSIPVISPKKSNAGLGTGNGAAPALGVGRAASNPIHGNFLGPGDMPQSARTVSSGAAYLNKIQQQQAAADLRPKTGKIGSSISQRIKALQEQTANGGGGGDVVTKERPSSTFFAVRQNSVRKPSRSPSVLERAASALKGTTPSPPMSRDSSPEAGRLVSSRDRSGSMANRLSMFETLPAPTARGRQESIQVKARIIRDPAQPYPRTTERRADPGHYGPLDLKQSPLVVDHRQESPVFGESSAETLPEGRQSLLQRRWSKGRRSESRDGDEEPFREPTNRPRRRSSLTVVKDFIKDTRDSIMSGRSPSTDNLSVLSPQSTGNLASPPLATPSSRSPSRPPSSQHNNSFFPRRLSINSRRSSIDQSSAFQSAAMSTGGLSPSLMTEASGESRDYLSGGVDMSRPGSNGSVGGLSPGPKNPNRATRFISRLSKTIGPTRKNGAPSISPTVAEESEAQIAAQNRRQVTSSASSSAGSTAQPVATYMGDVNVQFPDTLLWKRRTMCLDNQGFLILSAVQGLTATKQVAGAMKRYHMSQFRFPYLPDMDVQELPNSIVLDFVDGSGLQVACEDRAGQMKTLNMLQGAHQKHTSFGV